MALFMQTARLSEAMDLWEGKIVQMAACQSWPLQLVFFLSFSDFVLSFAQIKAEGKRAGVPELDQPVPGVLRGGPELNGGCSQPGGKDVSKILAIAHQ